MKLILTLTALSLAVTSQAQLKGTYKTQKTDETKETQHLQLRKNGKYFFMIGKDNKYISWQGKYTVKDGVIVRLDGEVKPKNADKLAKKYPEAAKKAEINTDETYLELRAKIAKLEGWRIINDSTVNSVGILGSALQKQAKKS